MRQIGIRSLTLLVLTVVFAFSSVLFVIVDVNLQMRAEVESIAREARMFAKEMDAAWRFMDASQDKINWTSDGVYEFKGLHCAIVGKSIGALFSQKNDYSISYTNLAPRNPTDMPDEFEREALERFDIASGVTEMYGIIDQGGVSVFRFVQALEVNESCLSCHGEPAGEIDVTGHVKEGWQIGDVGGCISVVIPLYSFRQHVAQKVIQDTVLLLLVLTAIGSALYLTLSRFVIHPLESVSGGLAALETHDFSSRESEDHLVSEVRDLAKGFNRTASELEKLYADLESQVSDRTADLERLNRQLERDSFELERLNDRLKQEVAYKSEFLSMVSHELRTPLTSVLATIQMASEATSNAEDGFRDSWESARRNALHLMSMIDNLLDMAKSEANSLQAFIAEMDPADVLLEVGRTGDSLCREKGIAFSMELDPDMPLAYGDEEMLLRMLENFVGNAVKFTPRGGRVGIAAKYHPEKSALVISVQDTGTGIPEVDQSRIFERFVQADNSATRRHGGSGLGLALVREYARLQEYSVTFESAEGVGSTFSVEIPEHLLIFNCE